MVTTRTSSNCAYQNISIQTFLTLMLANNYSRKEQKTNFYLLFIFLLLKLILNLPNYIYYKPLNMKNYILHCYTRALQTKVINYFQVVIISLVKIGFNLTNNQLCIQKWIVQHHTKRQKCSFFFPCCGYQEYFFSHMQQCINHLLYYFSRRGNLNYWKTLEVRICLPNW